MKLVEYLNNRLVRSNHSGIVSVNDMSAAAALFEAHDATDAGGSCCP
jgi:hypothetical protein